MTSWLPANSFADRCPLWNSRVFILIAWLSAWPSACWANHVWTLKSPTSRLAVKVEYKDGIRYSVSLHGQEVIAPSAINLKIAGKGWLARQGGNPAAKERSESETVDFVVPRKYRRLKTKYNELELRLANGAALVFRAYDEGVAYRWKTAFPGEIKIEDELAQFVFPGQPSAWFPEEESIFSHQERVYKYVPLAEVEPKRFCSTGVLVDLKDGRKIYISESDLLSYPGMFLRGVGEGKIGFAGKFAPYPLETQPQIDNQNGRNVPVTKAANYLAKTVGARTFPWRVMLVTEKDTELLQSEIIFNLAAPNVLKDTSWIKPGKATWEWWNDINVTGVGFRAGVNTATYKYYIDFAADHGVEYLLIDEGWNADPADILSERSDVNIQELVDYGKKKNVRILLWVLWNGLNEKLDAAMTKFEKLGVAGIKVDFMQRDDQWMVDFYERVAREAAKHHLLVDFHGAYKPTGLRRQYPNVMTREGVTGMEQYKWGDEKANPEQELVLPFVRMVAGPMDFTPGAMTNANKASWRWNVGLPMSEGTRCHQLAMYVVYESPLQMLCDSPTRYRQETECMKFLSAVPSVWDDTIALDAKVGDYIIVARRSGDQWYIGAMTDWTARELKLDFSFLPNGGYKLESWRDGVNADRNGQDFSFHTQPVSSSDKLTIKLAPGGGWVCRLHPISADGTVSINSQ
jgi:alpha-glucosidase